MPDEAPAADPFDAILRNLAEVRVDDAATARSRAHWLRHQAEESATLADALVELVHRGARVQLRVRGGTAVQGCAEGLGADALVVRTAAGTALVRIDRIAELRTTDGLVPSAAGRQHTAVGRGFAEILRDLAAERPPVHVHTDDGREQRGRLRAIGADVLTLHVGLAPPATVLVSLDAVTMVGLPPAA